MIYKHDNTTQTKWDRGEFQVQIRSPMSDKPMGFCDGSEADLAELAQMAEDEGAYEVHIDKKRLKSGREIWTVAGGGE